MQNTLPNHLGIMPLKSRPGGWLPENPRHTGQWMRKLRSTAKARNSDLIPPIEEFKRMVYNDKVLHHNVKKMFSEARSHEKFTPLDWEPEVEDFEEFLKLLNVIMTTAPECYFDSSDCHLKPAGLIGFPINALLDWPMATTAGYAVFANALVNQQFKKILNYWALFLKTPDSRYVLVDSIMSIPSPGSARRPRVGLSI